MKSLKNSIYLDAHATTPVDNRVLHEMLPYFTDTFGNGNHRLGWKTEAAAENARFQVSNLLGARPSEITFTSGATEAINMALFGLTKSNTSKRKHIVTQQTEHKAVLECMEALKLRGYRITYLAVDKVGRIDLDELKSVVTEQTLLVAIMLANNEIGTVQPLSEIGMICKEKGAKFFSDLTQGIGWYSIDVKRLNIDLAVLSAHKFHGPRGVGALYINKNDDSLNLAPIAYGGGQERGLRPGTINIPGVAGLGKACELLQTDGDQSYDLVLQMRNALKNTLFEHVDGIQLLGCPQYRHPGNLNIMIPGIYGDQLQDLMPEVYFSTGSACSSVSSAPSHVIEAISTIDRPVQPSIRFGIHKFNTMDEIVYVGNRLIQIIQKYQMVKKAS